MIYKPAKGAIWDPSVFWYEGKYYVVFMYNPEGEPGINAKCGFIAYSDDGVHWHDGWEITPEPTGPYGGMFYKAFIGRVGGRFVMNHGVLQPHGWQDTLRYYESTNLKDWNYIGSNMPDPQWYLPTGRWDHMYILPKDEQDPSLGYYGYPVATPKPGLPRGCGMCETTDGRSWKILPPPAFDWGNVTPMDMEIGGVERLSGKYVMLGGCSTNNGYLVHTLVSDSPAGPFRPDKETYRLCGNLTLATDQCGHRWRASQLAAWARCREGEKLISNYAQSITGTWMLPLRKPVFDGLRLRLGWWEENERLKGKRLPISFSPITIDASSGRQMKQIGLDFNPSEGVILEGTFKAGISGSYPFAGFSFSGDDGRFLDIRLELGEKDKRRTCIGWWNVKDGFTAADEIGEGCASVRGAEANADNRFRLLVRQGLFELYLNDFLVQTYFLNERCDGKIWLLVNDSRVEFSSLKVYNMQI